MTPKTWKKRPQKLLIIGPQFFYVLARLPKQPRHRNPVPPKAPQCRTGYLDWDACPDSLQSILSFIIFPVVTHFYVFMLFSGNKIWKVNYLEIHFRNCWFKLHACPDSFAEYPQFYVSMLLKTIKKVMKSEKSTPYNPKTALSVSSTGSFLLTCL